MAAAAASKSKITLQCVKENGKLRVKFYSFTDDEGKVFTNVYNNAYNCKFPRDLRVEGRFFEIGPNDLDLISRSGTPFYNVNKKNIKIIDNFDISSIRIFAVTECVACMCDEPNIIFAPCGHQCCCSGCYELIKKKVSRSNECILCRRKIDLCIPVSAAGAAAAEAED